MTWIQFFRLVFLSCAGIFTPAASRIFHFFLGRDVRNLQVSRLRKDLICREELFSLLFNPQGKLLVDCRWIKNA